MAQKLAPEAVQVRIKGVSTAKLLDARFVGMLEKEFPGIKYGPFHFYLAQDLKGEKLESILLGYFDPDNEKERLFSIGCEEPKTLEKFLRLFEQFLEGK